MATVLMGWELGAGLGHVQPLLRVAKELADHGHQPVFAVKNLLEASPLLDAEPFLVLQAPSWPARPTPGNQPFRAASYADILAIRGFSNAEELFPIVRAWQSLIDLVRPELIVCDHSPTLCLAAHRSVPVVMIGFGFTVPPTDTAEFPTLLQDVRPQMPQEHLLSVVREVQRRRNRPAPESLPGLFDDVRTFVCTFPELDPYQAVRREPAIGPITWMPVAESLPTRPSFFAYLAGDYRPAEQILAFLPKLGIAGSVYIRGAPAKLQQNLQSQGLEVYSAPAPLREVLPRVSAVLHHGGLLTAQDALTTGRPQLLLPRYLEQELNAQALQRLGVGKALSGRFTVQSVGQALHQLIADPRLGKQAVSWAKVLHERNLPDPLTAIVQHCLSMLRG